MARPSMPECEAAEIVARTAAGVTTAQAPRTCLEGREDGSVLFAFYSAAQVLLARVLVDSGGNATVLDD